MGKISDMRTAIASIYGPLFVSDMPPRQIVAVYNNMKSRGKFNPNSCHQMTLEDWIHMKGEEPELWETQ